MDDGSEGTSWLGNIVEKFEDLFSEVDVAVRQELTAVSNQLRTIMQYCRDLVEEEHHLPSESTEREPASEIDVKDSDSSTIHTDNDHREKESFDEYHLRCTCSTRVDAKSEVIDNENLVEGKHFQHETSVVVFPKEEVGNNLEADKLLQREMSDVVSLNEEESNNTEDEASSYISSPLPYSDHSTESCESLVLDAEVTPADPSTASRDDTTIAEGISHDEDRSALQCQILEKNCEDDLCSRSAQKDPEFEKSITDYLEATAIALPISRGQQAQITYLTQVQPPYSMMKRLTQNLHGIVQEEENLRASMTTTQEQEFCDSDWVIV